MKNILIDTNIVIDIMLQKSGYKTSSEILSLIKDDVLIGWFSGHSINTLHYLLRKSYKKELSKVLLKKFIDGFILIPTRNSSIDFESRVSDFEDSIIEKGAFQFNLDAIITRNKKNFENSRVPAYTPEEFLEKEFGRTQGDNYGKGYKTEKEKIPFLDLKAQFKDVYNDIDDEITNIISNTSFVMGKAVANFESSFAKLHNTKYCYGVSSGTDGNHLVLWALGIGPGDEVIIPDNTFIATAWGATLCGARPVFVDCHPESYNLDPQKTASSITHKTKAIIAVHLYGQPADTDGIYEQLKIKNYKLEADGVLVNNSTGQKIFLVEDCAQAHLARYKNIMVGGIGAASSFSFYPGKNLGAYGEAGAVMTNNEELAKKLKVMHEHGAEQKYLHVTYGHNYRMEGIQGAVLNVKLKYIEKWTEKRRQVAAKYRELLDGVEEIILPREMEYAKHVYHLFIIQVRSQASEAKSRKRDELQKFLSDNGISTGLHYPIPLHLQPCFEHLGYKKGDFPVAESLAEQGLSLPVFPELTDDKIKYVCDNIKKFFIIK